MEHDEQASIVHKLIIIAPFPIVSHLYPLQVINSLHF